MGRSSAPPTTSLFPTLIPTIRHGRHLTARTADRNYSAAKTRTATLMLGGLFVGTRAPSHLAARGVELVLSGQWLLQRTISTLITTLTASWPLRQSRTILRLS